MRMSLDSFAGKEDRGETDIGVVDEIGGEG